MSMNRVTGGLPYVQPNLLDKFQVDKKAKAEISDTAQKLVDLRAAVDTGRAALEALPDVREEKLAQARQRLQDGHYQSPEVQKKMSGILQGVLSKLDEL